MNDKPLNQLERPDCLLTSKQRFIAACHCKSLQRPPIWLMRQAGRYLPEYRTLKQHYTFTDLVHTPELAAEITLQPMRRFSLDAAIIFSDILVVAEALGQPYRYIDGEGIIMDWTLDNLRQIERMDAKRVPEQLSYIGDTIKIVHRALDGRRALLGFTGSPWTLANFMLEGGSKKNYCRALALYREQPAIYQSLAEKLTEAIIQYLRLQVDAGVDAIQIFDSLSGLIPNDEYMQISGKWIKTIIDNIGIDTTIIVYAKGKYQVYSGLASIGAHVVSVDSSVQLRDIANQLPTQVAVQGNLDPQLLLTTTQQVAAATSSLLHSMQGRPGYIVNLGHGVPPHAKIECIETLVQTVSQSRHES